MTELDEVLDDIRDYQRRVDIIMKCLAENIKTKDEYEAIIKALNEPLIKKRWLK